MSRDISTKTYPYTVAIIHRETEEVVCRFFCTHKQAVQMAKSHKRTKHGRMTIRNVHDLQNDGQPAEVWLVGEGRL